MGLVPYSDALEEVDVSQLPGVGAAFGVELVTMPRADSFVGSDGGMAQSEPGEQSDSGSEEGAIPRAAGGITPTPPELVEATIKKGRAAA